MQESLGLPVNESAKACPKCLSYEKEHGELRGEGGVMSSLFDVSTKRFLYISCKTCGYTEFYNSAVSGSAKVFDFLIT